MIIYKATNKISGNCYIGKTEKPLEERKKQHFKKVRIKPKSIFHKALKSYGKENFEWKIIHKANPDEDLDELEKKYIKEYNSFEDGYNMTEGGDGGDTISMKPKHLKKRQGAKEGNVPWNKGMDMKKAGYTYEHINPRTFTEKQKKKHSELIKNSKKFQEGIKNRKPAKQVSIKDNKGNVWNYQKDFVSYMKSEYGLSRYKIRKGLSNDVWKYKNRIFEVIKRK